MSDVQEIVVLSFTNRHYNPVNIYWVTELKTLQTTLNPGETYQQGTYPGEKWEACDQMTDEVLVDIIARESQDIEVIGDFRRMRTKNGADTHNDASHKPTAPDINFALDFDGENDVVIVKDEHESLKLGDTWTLEAWVFRKRRNVEHPVLEKSDGVEGGYALRIGANNKVQAGVLDGTTFIYGESETEIMPRRWYHVAASFRGNTAFKYTDQFAFITDDKGSGFASDVSFYRPIPPEGYVSLGDYAQADHSPATRRTLVARNDARVVVAPREYVPVAAVEFNALFGGNADIPFFTVWRPVSPDEENFVALGYIIETGNSNPNDNPPRVFCVARDLVEPTSIEPKQIWSTKKSGFTAFLQQFNDSFEEIANVVTDLIGNIGSVFSGLFGRSSAIENARAAREERRRRAEEAEALITSKADARIDERLEEEKAEALDVRMNEPAILTEIDDVVDTQIAAKVTARMAETAIQQEISDDVASEIDNLLAEKMLEEAIQQEIVANVGVELQTLLSNRMAETAIQEEIASSTTAEIERRVDARMAEEAILNEISGRVEGGEEETTVTTEIRSREAAGITTSDGPAITEAETTLVEAREKASIDAANREAQTTAATATIETRERAGIVAAEEAGITETVTANIEDREEAAIEATERASLTTAARETIRTREQSLIEAQGGTMRAAIIATELNGIKNDLRAQRDGGDVPLQIWGIQGMGGFIAAESNNPPGDGVFQVKPDVLAKSFSEVKCYINGQPDKTVLRHSLDLASARATLDLNGENEFLALSPIHADTSGVLDFRSAFTIELWVNPKSEKDNQTFLSRHDSSGNNVFRLGFFDGCLNVSVDNLTRTPKPAESDTFTGWHHLAVVMNNGTLSVYKNAQLQYVQTMGALQTSNLNPWMLGKGGVAADTDFFQGQLAEVRFWSEARNAASIEAYWNREIGNDDKLEAYWPLDEGTRATRLLDFSNNAFHVAQRQPATALHFDGSTTEIDLPETNADFSRGLTIEGWVFLNELASEACLIDLGNAAGSNNIMLTVKPATQGTGDARRTVGQLSFTVKSDASTATALTATGADIELSLMQWIHVAVTVTRRKGVISYILYRDGEEIARQDDAAFPLREARDKNAIGKAASGGMRLNGFMAELRVWRRGLHPKTIAQSYLNQLPANQTQRNSLIAYWPLGADARDLSQNGFNGTLVPADAAFEQSDLWLQPGDKPHRWNQQSDLRLLPFSVVPKSSPAPLKIGALEPQNSLMRYGLRRNTNFYGFIDSVRVWDDIRTPAEIAALWNQKLDVEDAAEIADLKGYWRFDEGAGNTATDLSGNINDGEFGGANRMDRIRIAASALTVLNKDDAAAAVAEISERNDLVERLPEVLLDGTPLTDANQGITRRFDLNGSFSIEAVVKIDTFVLSGKEHYLIFAQDAWALSLFEERGVLYFGFIFKDEDAAPGDPWQGIYAKDVDVAGKEWVYVAVGSEGAGSTLQLVVDGEVVSMPLPGRIKASNQPIRMGEEGKPKWAISSLLLMDGIKYDGSDLLLLPEMVTDFTGGFTLETWAFFDELDSTTEFIQLGASSEGNQVILAAVPGSSVPEPAEPEPGETAELPQNGRLIFKIVDAAGQQMMETGDVFKTGRWTHIAVTIGKGKLEAFSEVDFKGPATNLSIGTSTTQIHNLHSFRLPRGFVLEAHWRSATATPATRVDTYTSDVRSLTRHEGYALEMLTVNAATLYVNGAPVSTNGTVSLPGVAIRKQSFFGRQLNGSLDEVRLWKTSRSARQIEGYMRRELPAVHEKLLGLWRCDEGGGITAYDSTANGYHATLGGDRVTAMPQWNVPASKVQTGLLFQADDQQVRLPAMQIPLDDGFTIELWTKFKSIAGTSDILQLGESDNQFILQREGTDIVFGAGGTTLRASNAMNALDPIPLQSDGELVDEGPLDWMNRAEWIHIAAVVDRAGAATLHVNYERLDAAKNLRFTRETGNITLPDTDVFANNLLGQNSSAENTFAVDELRIWRAPRTVTQIRANLFSHVDRAADKLAGYWPMDENGGNVLHDKTIARQHGEIEGAVQWIETSDIQFDGYHFDGATEYVEIPVADALNLTKDFSITAWIKPNRFRGLQGILSKVNDLDNCQYALSLEGEMLRFDYENEGNNYAVIGGTVKDGWNHVAVSVKSREVNVYEAVTTGSGGDTTFAGTDQVVEGFTNRAMTGTAIPFAVQARDASPHTTRVSRIRALKLPEDVTATVTWRKTTTEPVTGASLDDFSDAVTLPVTPSPHTAGVAGLKFLRVPDGITAIVRWVNSAPAGDHVPRPLEDYYRKDAEIKLREGYALQSIEVIDTRVDYYTSDGAIQNHTSDGFRLESIGIQGTTQKLVARSVVLPKIHLYVNGFLVHSDTAPVETVANDADLNIGAWGGKIRNHFFHGKIDSVALWETALSQRQIQENIDARVDAVEQVAGYWLLDEGIAQTGVIDKGSDTHHGALGRYDREGNAAVYEPRPSIAFNGVDSQLDTGGIHQGEKFTVELWANPENTVGKQCFISKHNDFGQTVFWFGIEDGQIACEIGGHTDRRRVGNRLISRRRRSRPGDEVDANPPSTTPVNIDEEAGVDDPDAVLRTVNLTDRHAEGDAVTGWQHYAIIAVQEDEVSTRVTVLKNGKLFWKRLLISIPNVPSRWVMGMNRERVELANRPADFYNGQLADIRIWNVERTPNQVRDTLYNLLSGSETGLVGYWPFDEGLDNMAVNRPANIVPRDEVNVTAHTDSGMRLLVSRSGLERLPNVLAAPENLFVEQEVCLSLNGRNQHAVLEESDPGTSFTLELWVNPASMDDGQCFLSKHDRGSTDLLRFGFYRGGLFFGLRGFERQGAPAGGRLPFGDSEGDGDGLPSPGGDGDTPVPRVSPTLPHEFVVPDEKFTGWHHVAVTVTPQGRGSLITMYRDGDLLATKALRVRPSSLAGKPWLLGTDLDNNSETDFFGGELAEVRIWNRVRTAAEIKSNYHQRLYSQAAGLIGLWPLTNESRIASSEITISSGQFVPMGSDLALHRAPGLTFLNMGPTSTGIAMRVALPEQEAATEVTLSDVDPGEAFTLELWANPASNGNWAVSRSHAGADIVRFGVDQRQVYFEIRGERHRFGSRLPANEGWYHLAAVVETQASAELSSVNASVVTSAGTTTAAAVETHTCVTVYKSDPEATFLQPNPVPTDVADIEAVTDDLDLGAPLGTAILVNRIGGAPDGTWMLHAQSGNTSFSEVRLWDAARTPAQVNLFKNRRLFGSEDNLVGHWALDGDVPDFSGDGGDGLHHSGTFVIEPSDVGFVTETADGELQLTPASKIQMPPQPSQALLEHRRLLQAGLLALQAPGVARVDDALENVPGEEVALTPVELVVPSRTPKPVAKRNMELIQAGSEVTVVGGATPEDSIEQQLLQFENLPAAAPGETKSPLEFFLEKISSATSGNQLTLSTDALAGIEGLNQIPITQLAPRLELTLANFTFVFEEREATTSNIGDLEVQNPNFGVDKPIGFEMQGPLGIGSLNFDTTFRFVYDEEDKAWDYTLIFQTPENGRFAFGSLPFASSIPGVKDWSLTPAALSADDLATLEGLDDPEDETFKTLNTRRQFPLALVLTSTAIEGTRFVPGLNFFGSFDFANSSDDVVKTMIDVVSPGIDALDIFMMVDAQGQYQVDLSAAADLSRAENPVFVLAHDQFGLTEPIQFRIYTSRTGADELKTGELKEKETDLQQLSVAGHLFTVDNARTTITDERANADNPPTISWDDLREGDLIDFVQDGSRGAETLVSIVRKTEGHRIDAKVIGSVTSDLGLDDDARFEFLVSDTTRFFDFDFDIKSLRPADVKSLLKGRTDKTIFSKLSDGDEVAIKSRMDKSGKLVAEHVARFKRGSDTVDEEENKLEVKYGVEAGTTISLDAGKNPVFTLVNDIFGIDEVELSISGQRTNNDPPELSIEASTMVDLVSADQPLLTVVRDFFGLETIKLALKLEKRAEGGVDTQAIAEAALNMRSLKNPVMQFLLDLFAVEDLTMDLLIAIGSVDGEVGFNVTSTTVVRLEDSKSDFFKLIEGLFQIEEIKVILDVTEESFEIRIDLGVNAELSDAARFVSAFIQIQLQYMPPPPNTRIGLGLTFEFDTDDSIIKLTGMLGVNTGPAGVQVDGSLTMEGAWHNPLGIEGVVIADLAATLGVQPDAPWISKVGFAGKLQLGKTYMELAMLANLKNPRESGFVGEIKHLALIDVVNTLTGPDNAVPKELSYVLEDIRLNQFKLSIIPVPPMVIGTLEYNEEGITAICDVDMWDFEAFMYLQANYTDGITAFASFKEMELVKGIPGLPPLLKIEGMDETGDNVVPRPNLPARFVSKGGPEMYVRLSPYDPPEIFLQGKVTLLDAISKTVAVYLNEDGMEFVLEDNLFGLFRTRLEARVATDFSSVYIKAEMQNDFLAKIREEVTKGIQAAADAALEEIRKAKEEVEKIYTDIERMRVQVKAEREAIQRRLRQAKAKIDGAQREVNRIKGEIDRTKRYYNSLPDADWPWKASKAREWVWVGPKLGGLYVAYGAATAALQAAKLLLDGIDKVIDIVPIDADPRIVALFVVYETAKGALNLAEATVGGVASLAMDIANFALGEFFDVRYAMFEGNFSTAGEGKFEVKMQAKIVFMGTHHDITFTIDLLALQKGIEGLVTDLIENVA